jgi:hypothetical protein
LPPAEMVSAASVAAGPSRKVVLPEQWISGYSPFR